MNNGEEKLNLIKQLCLIQLNHDVKLRQVSKVFNQPFLPLNDMDDTLHNLFSIDIVDIALDLIGLPKDNSSDVSTDDENFFCRDYFSEQWFFCVSESFEIIEENKYTEDEVLGFNLAIVENFIKIVKDAISTY